VRETSECREAARLEIGHRVEHRGISSDPRRTTWMRRAPAIEVHRERCGADASAEHRHNRKSGSAYVFASPFLLQDMHAFDHLGRFVARIGSNGIGLADAIRDFAMRKVRNLDSIE
jgi:hypothetical protein